MTVTIDARFFWTRKVELESPLLAPKSASLWLNLHINQSDLILYFIGILRDSTLYSHKHPPA